MKRHRDCFCDKYMVSFLWLSLLLAITGCNVVWNILNRSSLKQDISELALLHGAKITSSTCNMIDTSRQGYCIFSASEKEIRALADGLKLVHVRAEYVSNDAAYHTDNNTHERALIYLEQTIQPFEIYKVDNKTNIKTFFISGRPAQLRLKSGRAFEYFLLYYDPITLRACIFVCYAYG